MGDWISGATRNIFMESGLRWKQEPNKLGCHTTEGSGFPSKATYRNGQSAPHLTTHPRARQTQQHYPFSRPAYALAAPAGYSTNTMGIVQIEIVGTCEDRLRSAAHSVYSFNSGDLQYLADIFGQISDETGIVMESSLQWKTYPASYGLNNGIRLSQGAFNNYRGVLGHQHVPGNTHGDPGDFIPRVLSILGGKAPSLTTGDDDMMLILSPKLGGAVVAGGWYRQLQSMTDVESFQAGGLVLKEINDQQHAIIRDNCLNATRLDAGLGPTVWGHTLDKLGDDGPAPATNWLRSILGLVKKPGDVTVNVERLSDDDVERIVDAYADRLSKNS